MKALKRRIVVIAITLTASLVSIDLVCAQSAYFVDRFMGATLGNHLQDVNSEFLLGKGYVHRGGNEGPASANRHYITTVRQDYISRDWTYDITFFSPIFAPDDILFIGFGEAVQDDSYFNEPRNSLMFRIHQGQFAFFTNWRVDVAAHTVGPAIYTYFNEAVGFLPANLPDGGLFTARIRKSGKEVTFQILDTPILVIIPDVSIAAPFLSQSNSRIFFGNASTEYLFSDMRVLPASVDAAQ